MKTRTKDQSKVFCNLTDKACLIGYSIVHWENCEVLSALYLQTPSISICSRSSKNWYSYTDTRIKSCVHHQAGSQSNSDVATIFRTIGTDLGRDCYRGPGNIFAQRPSAWQKAGKNQNRSSLNIVLIAYRSKNSLWSMSF